ncbi:MAG TPA: SRPBCC family protein [Gemmataceae bacterium]|nr:SRPBCC family protein [Gemmataceae bacterium]
MSTATPTPQRRRVKKRILIPVILLGVLLLAFVWLYVRGTWADSVAHNPQTAADGAITQLFRTPQGDVQVRCAIVIDAPAAKVWDVIRDYPNHPRFLPYVSAMQAKPEEGDRVHLTGTAHSRLWGDWHFAAHVDHKKVSDKEYVASWDEPGETMTVNRGSWALTALEPGKTLVVYALQAEPKDYPKFLVRNLLLSRLSSVLNGVRDEVKRRQAGT